MKKRTLTECLRLNIKQNWSEGGFFEYMTKKDCLEACDEIDKLQAENERLREALETQAKRHDSVCRAYDKDWGCNCGAKKAEQALKQRGE